MEARGELGAGGVAVHSPRFLCRSAALLPCPFKPQQATAHLCSRLRTPPGLSVSPSLYVPPSVVLFPTGPCSPTDRSQKRQVSTGSPSDRSLWGSQRHLVRLFKQPSGTAMTLRTTWGHHLGTGAPAPMIQASGKGCGPSQHQRAARTPAPKPFPAPGPGKCGHNDCGCFELLNLEGGLLYRQTTVNSNTTQ